MNDNLACRDEALEELIDGKLVAISPRPAFNHNQISGNLPALFWNDLRGHTHTSIIDGTDLYLTEKDHFIPDMMIVCD